MNTPALVPEDVVHKRRTSSHKNPMIDQQAEEHLPAPEDKMISGQCTQPI